VFRHSILNAPEWESAARTTQFEHYGRSTVPANPRLNFATANVDEGRTIDEPGDEYSTQDKPDSTQRHSPFAPLSHCNWFPVP
jgi:hypothetical protein